MTLTVINPTGSFYCKKCEITFNATYKPQQRPRKSCPGCHKMAGMTVKKSSKTKSTNKPDTEKKGEGAPYPHPTKLTEKYLEKLIVDGLKANPGNVQLIGKATEFYLKVLIKSDTMENEMDIEELLKLGIVKEFSN